MRQETARTVDHHMQHKESRPMRLENSTIYQNAENVVEYSEEEIIQFYASTVDIGSIIIV